MQFQMPVKTFFGENVIWTHRQYFSHFGSRALLVTGKNSAKKSGALEDVLKVLEEQTISYVHFDEIEENPSVATVLKATQLGREAQVDFVIGIGGGSPLDASKAIAMCLLNEDLNEENIFSQPPREALPVIAVPTTSGTGSEVTQYAVLTDHIDQTKKNLGQTIFPKVAYLDPRYTYSLNPEISLHTAVDAFTHLAEGFLNSNASEVSDALAIRGFKVFGACLKPLEASDYRKEVREDLMLASMLAGMVIAQTGTSLPHGMGYGLTYHYGLPHGLANGILFSAYLEQFKDQSKVNEMVKALGLSELSELTAYLRKWNQTETVPSEEVLGEFAAQMAQNQGKLKNHPEKVTEEELLKLYLKSFELDHH